MEDTWTVVAAFDMLLSLGGSDGKRSVWLERPRQGEAVMEAP